jgi:transposase
LADWLPQGHLAWFVLDAVEQIDLQPFYEKYRTDGVGNSAFNPSLMVGLLLYSYCTGERSSRRIERFCQTDVAYKVITANQSPDHSTISRFRKDNESYLKSLFLEVLRLCVGAGLDKLGKVSLDGTKIKANASLAANRRLKHLEQEVEKMLSEAEAKDAEEDKTFGPDNRGDELPEDLRDRKSRLNRLKACKERLEREKALRPVRLSRPRLSSVRLAKRRPAKSLVAASRSRPKRLKTKRLRQMLPIRTAGL